MSGRHLELRVASECGSVQLPTRGSAVPFRKQHADGSAFMVHRPNLGTPGANAVAHDARLTKSGACFEAQIQIHFKTAPRGPVFLTGELRDAQMKLNLVTRALCRVLLGVIKQQANKRGVEFRYSFGDSTTRPSITVPLLACDRVIVSDSPVQLPIDTDEDTGTWKHEEGKLVPMDRSAVRLEAGSYLTIMFATKFLDFEQWAVTNIPGVGNLNLTQFWGSQPLHVVAFDESAGRASKDTHVFFEMELASVIGKAVEPAQSPVGPEADEEDVKDTVMELVDPAAEEPEAAPEVPVHAGDGDKSDICTHYTDEDSQEGQEGMSSSEDEPEPGDEEWEMQSNITMQSRTLLAALNAQRQFNKQDLEGCSDMPMSMAHNTNGHKSELVSIPWYCCNGAGDLWWCIDYKGFTCWRHHSQLQELCTALGGQLPQLGAKSSIRNLEFGRRLASRLLLQGASAPGLLEEFTEMHVSLGSLLSGEIRSASKAMFAGVVEAEGRIVERYIRAQGQTLRWFVGRSRHRRAKLEVSVDLKHVNVVAMSVAGAQGLKLQMPQKSVILLAKDQNNRSMMEHSLRNLMINKVFSDALEKIGTAPTWEDPVKPSGSRLSIYRSLLLSTLSEAAGRMPGKDWILGTVTAAHDKAFKAATKLRRPAPPWKDLLVRWPANRIVVNNSELYLEPPPADPLAFSAALLRAAVAAGADPELAHEVTRRSCGLKCVDLTLLGEQDLWSFWVNVYHCLLVHAQLVAGTPGNIQQIVGFYNSCSYLVAGHVFSLVEIEHCILRRHMTKPRVLLVRTILKIWPRTDQDLETRPCLASPVCAARCFACRPDWRLNLVLNAGNTGCSDAVPVFEATDEVSFDKIVRKAMDRTLACCGSVKKGAIELPYNLCRYREDAPVTNPADASERRWVKILWPDLAETVEKVVYRRVYGWSMRQRLDLISDSYTSPKMVSL